MSAIDKASLIRIVVFLLAWLNQYLSTKGIQTIPVLGEDEVAAVITFVASVWALVRDNRLKKADKEIQ